MEYFWSQKSHPTAIVTSNDLMAIGVYKFCKTHNIRIPQDLSVIGFDDIESSSHLDPSLTTLRQPFAEVGKLATELLFSHIGNKNVDNHIVKLKTELIIRDSCMKMTQM